MERRLRLTMAHLQQAKRPAFDALPLDKNGPPGNAWGLYGKQDQLGSLNQLTPAVVANAAKEIRTGERVSLDWTLNNPSPSFFGRQSLTWKMHPSKGRPVNDDSIQLNTQCGTQWDGFRHYGYRQRKLYFGGRTQDELEQSDAIGINVWADNGGIVGRGHLLDYYAHCQREKIPLDPLKFGGIPLAHLKAIVQEKQLDIRPGDILFVRCGFVKAYTASSTEQRKALVEGGPPTEFFGVESTRAMLEWIWESGFSAVAGDAVAFEQLSADNRHTVPGGLWKGESWEHEMQGGLLLHQWLLAGWGCPIGEMFDLERLAETCELLNRWTFFVSSVPLKVSRDIQQKCDSKLIRETGSRWRGKSAKCCGNFLVLVYLGFVNGNCSPSVEFASTKW